MGSMLPTEQSMAPSKPITHNRASMARVFPFWILELHEFSLCEKCTRSAGTWRVGSLTVRRWKSWPRCVRTACGAGHPAAGYERSSSARAAR
jgi:hypothetical protein